MGPTGYLPYPSVFHRVPVDVIGVSTEVDIVPDEMLPKAALP
jgi:hypothetical protein